MPTYVVDGDYAIHVINAKDPQEALFLAKKWGAASLKDVMEVEPYEKTGPKVIAGYVE